MTAKAGEVTTTDYRTATFSTGGGKYNMTGWHVRPLHHGANLAKVYQWHYRVSRDGKNSIAPATRLLIFPDCAIIYHKNFVESKWYLKEVRGKN